MENKSVVINASKQVFNIKKANSTKIKILHIVESMGGGVFTYLVDLSNRLCDKYDIYIAYAVRAQTPKDYRNYFDKKIKLIEVKNFTRSIDLIKDVKAFIEIRKIENEINPNIIHLHSSKAGVLGRWAFNCRKIPVYYTPHGYSFLMQNYSLTKRIIYRILEKISSKKFCTTISCSIGEHKETLKLTKRALYVNNGINIEALQKMIDKCSMGIDNNHQFTIFTLGRICYQKNPELFNEIAEKFPNIRFLWIGDGQLKNTLTSKNIEITGWVDREKALKFAISSDAFILTSLWEGLPISLLEAMYMKKPCIVSNVIGNKDVIKDRINGYICNNTAEYSNAINTISSDNLDKIVNRAYEDTLHKYNTDIMVSEYNEIYLDRLNS